MFRVLLYIVVELMCIKLNILFFFYLFYLEFEWFNILKIISY